MSKEKARNFIEQIRHDTKLKAKLLDVNPQSQEESLNTLVYLGAQQGFTFARGDMLHVLKERLKKIQQSGELSDHQLDAIFGGNMDIFVEGIGKWDASKIIFL